MCANPRSHCYWYCFFLVLLPELLLNLIAFHNYGFTALFAGMIVLYLMIFSTGTVKYIQLRRRIKC